MQLSIQEQMGGVPAETWMLVKPVRELAPSLAGVGCVSETLDGVLAALGL
ncbi:MAG: hypothetical protein IPH37_01115 [Burkholderiales bacterium]|nr:hypothetical protein [Burkholderiales bacterium]MBK9345861.1 hypothetical protein [Burkholderiales bacterium]